MSSSSYHYAISNSYKCESTSLITAIRKIRRENNDYGYRRVTLELRNLGIIVNHKHVLKIMRENNLLCSAYKRKTRKYNSYKGTIGKITNNKLNRRFMTDRPYQKIVTDVTELRWGDQTTSERAYFTSYVDLFNGEIVTWNLSLHPTVEFVIQPLEELLSSRPHLPYRMTIHSDQGFQYQNYEYVSRLKEQHVFQSMSHKATCLDNAAAESSFHILKVGTVHNHSYKSYDELSKAVSDYVTYYNNKRIKTKLAGMSPVNYRIHASQKVA